MTEMNPEARTQFEKLHADGMRAKDAGDHENALELFLNADEVASTAGDSRKRLDALNPTARALWSMGRYGEATSKLQEASSIAESLGLMDESSIAISNMGRIAAVKTVKTVPIPEQADRLRNDAVPNFIKAREMLAGHGHLYFRYANAQHGSVVAALASERGEVLRLVSDGLGVAFRKSPEPYDQKRTFRISPRGLGQMAVAAGLLAFGNKTPVLAKKAREKYVR